MALGDLARLDDDDPSTEDDPEASQMAIDALAAHRAAWQTLSASDDAYAPRPPVTTAELLAACETLLHAGFTNEALAVLATIRRRL